MITRGLIEATQSTGRRKLAAEFPRVITRGLIEANDQPNYFAKLPSFPRVITRGLIEATGLDLHRGHSRHFRG